MTNYECWLKALEESNSKCWPLMETQDRKLFKVQNWVMVGNREIGQTPVYVCWQGDQRKVTTDMQLGYTLCEKGW